MKRLIVSLMAGAVFVLTLAAAPSPFVPAAMAQSNEEALCEGTGGSWNDGQCVPPSGDRTLMGTIQQIVNILLFIAGAIAVLMIIIGGVRYIASAGDQNAVTAAKNTILYAIIGLIIAIAAYAIVNFVLTALDVSSGESNNGGSSNGDGGGGGNGDTNRGGGGDLPL